MEKLRRLKKLKAIEAVLAFITGSVMLVTAVYEKKTEREAKQEG